MATHPETPTREPRADPMDRPAAPVAATGQSSGKATTSMVLGIISIPVAILIPIIGLVIGIVGLTLGLMARGDIDRRGLSNRGQAKAGVILNSIGMVLAIAIVIAAVIVGSN
jgi:Domain of unknown function (DUF4190)